MFERVKIGKHNSKWYTVVVGLVVNDTSVQYMLTCFDKWVSSDCSKVVNEKMLKHYKIQKSM